MGHVGWIVGSVLHFTFLSFWVLLVAIPIICLTAVQWPVVWGCIISWNVVTRFFKFHPKPWLAFRNGGSIGWGWARKLFFGKREIVIDGPGASLLSLPAKQWPKGSMDAFAGPVMAKESPGVIVACHPHGFLTLGATMTIGLGGPQFNWLLPAVHSGLFYLPFIGTFSRWLDAIPVTRRAIMSALLSGQSIAMCPDGVNDIVHKGKDIKERTGFLRLARAAKTVILPTWMPNERSYFTVWTPLGDRLKGPLNYPIPCIVWPPIPRRKAIRVIVGNPFDPGQYETLEEAKDAYYEALRELMDM